MIKGVRLLPLTHPQLRIWHIEELYPNTCIHNIGGLVRIQGLVEMPLLEQAIHAFLVKNTGVRLQLSKVEGEVKQFLSSEPPTPLRFFDFRSEVDPEQTCSAWVQREFTTPFPLLEHPLYDFALVRIDEKTTGYFVKLHHIIADGWSIQLMTEQISTFYESLIEKQALELQPDDGYIGYIEEEQKYLQSERFQRDRRFWQQIFADPSETFLIQSNSNLTAVRRSFEIDAGRTSRLRQLAQRKKWSLNTLFVSALLLYFQKLQQQHDMIIGIPVFNRRGAREKNLVGMFTSTMPFRMHFSPRMTLEAFQEVVSQNLLKCFFHQKYPYNILIQDLGVDRLFHLCVNYYNTKLPNAISGYPLQNIEWFSGLQIYSLQVIIKDWLDQGTLQLMIDYKQCDYTEERIQHLFDWMINFIDITLEAHNIALDEIGLLSAAEKQRIVYQRNMTAVAYPQHQPVQFLFEEQVKRTPSAIALIDDDQLMTYEELNVRANQLALALRQAHVGPNVVVGILAQHSNSLIVGILGILKAGGAYLPLDPSYPLERLNYIISDSQASLLLTDQDLPTDLQFAGQVLPLSTLELYQIGMQNISTTNQLDDLVYLIYTSGSTGKPKGIMIEHRSLINYLWWAKKTYIRSQHDRFALYSSIAFDLTVTSIFTPLISGNAIVLYRDDQHEFLLYRILRDNLCSIVKATPAHLALLDDCLIEHSHLRCLIVGGEDLRTNIASRIWQKFAGHVRIFNEYGPTEATVGCMIHEYHFERDTDVSVPIGRPIDNTHIYLLTQQLQPVPDGVTAEIYVAGDGIARGYVNSDTLTSEKFCENPFLPGERMYKTGDLGRYSHGAIEYMGRADHQVKIQGYRIELAEIEGELLKHDAIKQAVVCVKHTPQGQKYLIAFVQLSTPLPTIEIKRFLAQSLPTFMIPTQVIKQQDFPLSPSGKIDRDALTLLDNDELDHSSPQADQVLEHQLIEIVREILGVENITSESNIYFLGADSIKAIQISSRLQASGYQAKPTDILTYPIIRELALVLATQGQVPTYSQQPCEGFVKNTPIADWFFSQRFPAPDFWHQSLLLELHLHLPDEQLNHLLRVLVHHHDALRLNCDEKAMSFFYNHRHLVADLQVLDSIDIPANKEEAFPLLCSSFKARFQLSHGLLFRALRIRTPGRSDRLLLVAHHMIIDGISWRILLEDFQTLLLAYSRGEKTILPKKTASIQLWAEALRDYTPLIEAPERAFWKHMSSEMTHVPADFATDRDTVEHRRTCIVELSLSETRQLLTDANRAYATQTHDLLLASLALTLADLLHTEEIVLELEAHGREALFEHLDVSHTVGWFTALYPLRLQVGSTDLASTISTIREQLRQVPKNGIGFGLLASFTQEILPLARPGIRWNYLGEIDNGQKNEFFTLSLEDTGPDSAPVNHLTCELEILALVHAQKLRVMFIYSQTRYREAIVQRVADKFLFRLQDIIGHCCYHGQQGTSLEITASLTEEELLLLFEDEGSAK